MNDKLIYLREVTDEQLRNELELRGYYTNNLWSVEDVTRNHKLSIAQAQDVLDAAMTSEWVVSQVFEMIDSVITDNKLTNNE